MRPYDGCSLEVADQRRHHYLPAGSRFFKPAQPAARYADNKNGRYTALLQTHALKRKVLCMFEVSGEFSKSALALLKKAADMALKSKVWLRAGEWSWSAMGFFVL